MLGQSIAGLDTEAFRVVVSRVSWRVNERRVSGVAATHHSMLVVPPTLVGTVDLDGKTRVSRQIVFDDAAQAFREFLFDRLSPADDRHHVGVVVRLKQRETLAIVEFPIKIDGIDAEVKAVKVSKKLCEDAAGGVTVSETAHRQRVAFVLHTCVECVA